MWERTIRRRYSGVSSRRSVPNNVGLGVDAELHREVNRRRGPCRPSDLSRSCEGRGAKVMKRLDARGAVVVPSLNRGYHAVLVNDVVAGAQRVGEGDGG